MSWRERFDTTTHWAIIAVTGLISFAWTNPGSGHFLFILSNLILYLLLSIEARRYRFYDAYRARVRILEAHFIFPTVAHSSKIIEGDWRKTLATDLLLPSFKISYWEALSRRFNRNYLWLFLLSLLAWIAQMANLHRLGNASTWSQQIELALPISSNGFLLLLAAFYLYLGSLAISGLRARQASGEFHKRKSSSADAWSL